jgi:enamine deaminase RidA (YjgF/YER057c/UK114 family)
MKISHRSIIPALALFVGIACIMAPAQAANRAVDVDPNTGLATAVVVENKALAHTTQLAPVDGKNKVVGTSLNEQLGAAMANVETVLSEVGSGLSELVRLNVYVTTNGHVEQARRLLKTHLGPDSHPVATFVVTELPHHKTLVAVDAIATVSDDRAPAKVLRHISPKLAKTVGVAHVTVLPKGRTLYISGMADPEGDLADATTGTMEQLHTVLALNGIGPEEVVHLKAYMKPMDESYVAEEAMAYFYPDQTAPAMTFIEWRNGIPIEIELIAHLPGKGDSEDPVQLLWQPEEKRSPVYCRFAIVNSTTRIYTQGFLSQEAVDADGQIRSIYQQLEATLTPLGSDFRHLVKATYLHSADDTSKALNAIRPELYDPKRPPAASKANIAGTGDEQRTMLIDMIAVPSS